MRRLFYEITIEDGGAGGSGGGGGGCGGSDDNYHCYDTSVDM